MLHDQFGIINAMLIKLGLIATPIAWTASADTAMAAVMMVDIWKTTPFMALLILAGLQMIPDDIYEAARLDGINPVRVFRSPRKRITVTPTEPQSSCATPSPSHDTSSTPSSA